MKHSTKTRIKRVSGKATKHPPPESDARGAAVVETLSLRVRVLSVGQIARTWWAGQAAPVRSATELVQRLVKAGRVEVHTLLAQPEIELAGPLATWQPGLPIPDLARIANVGRTRWTGTIRATKVVIATRSAADVTGGVAGRLPRSSEATHDLHLAAVFLRMRQELPARARSWTSEASTAAARSTAPHAPRSGEKLPDAMVRDGRARTAVECVGEYSPAKLAAFHEYCVRSGMGYELW